MDKEKNKEIGIRLKKFRQSKGLNQKEFGILLDKKEHQVRDMESGKVEISSSFAKLLYYEFKINPSWMLSGEGDMYLPSVERVSYPDEIQRYLDMAAHVLQSPHNDSHSLKSNIESFFEAVNLKDEKKNEMEKRLDGLENQIKTLLYPKNNKNTG